MGHMIWTIIEPKNDLGKLGLRNKSMLSKTIPKPKYLQV